MHTSASAVARIIATITPYNAKASPKININNTLINKLCCWPIALHPASPHIPNDKPAARHDNPHDNPLPKCAYASYDEYWLPSGVGFLTI